MKGILTFASAIVLGSVLAGCKQKAPLYDPCQMQAMVNEIVAVANAYYDSVKHSPDSDLIRVMTNFDDAMTKITYKYPSDIYIHFHDGENDTITEAILRVIFLRDSILNRKQHGTIIYNGDTIPVDSLPPIPYRR